jgi:hypothetical protein
VTRLWGTDSRGKVNLRHDSRRISAIQGATLTTERYGIVQDHWLFGSDEWWQAIESGALVVNRIEGSVSRVYMSGHNDFPEFEIDDGNSKTQWERFGDESKYIEGQRVVLEYVQTKSRFSNELQPSVVRVWLSAKSAA